ncbi:hypothetical protein FHS95_001431 [Sphingomonas naasensis]|uniref:DUF4034 domain-containing protein n=1 Tax=Sphingomonas naasensis TaxID=1344951 RepID=A0A4S1WER0_9SPHN|nr:DUF6624 domain-containing protein [Sphingomonas naasensis]NIJ19762.1 hypothetical protein [Sphingomonas naasensis]TGX40097.1 hypothetical protein E5A74_16135 [Sphingomonas naasensis]
MRRLLLLGALAASIAVPAAAQPLDPPSAIAVHVRDGLLDTTDLSWLKGAFSRATTAEKADWIAALRWADACSAAREREVRAELRAMGVESVALPHAGDNDDRCFTFGVFALRARAFADWASFDAAARAARTRWEIFAHGVRLGAESVPFEPGWVNGNAEAMKLLRAVVREQAYRRAFSWRMPGQGPVQTDPEWALLEAYISVAVGREDHRNTEMLKALIAEKGWPSIPRVGAPASNAAWLLAQHADLDPAFQLKVLRLMEPLSARGEVSRSDYAYLYDRTMLKLSGKQRYATQAHCEGGKRLPQLLEKHDAVDARRAWAGLGPLAEYLASLDASFGPCPAN